MYDVFTLEKVREQDKIVMGYFSYLGIENGKPFAPIAISSPPTIPANTIRHRPISIWFFVDSCEA